MNSKTQKFFARFAMLALVAFLALPLTAFAQDNSRGRDGQDNRNGAQRRGDRNRDNDEARRQEQNRIAQLRRQQEQNRAAELRRQQEQNRNEELRRQQGNNNDWRRGNDDNNDRNRRGRDWSGYGTYGGSSQLRQTALNAGYNNGIQEGRKDRSRGERFEYRDEGDYASASEDYNSRYGDRQLYQRYFREGFANGYRDGYNGY